jgi:hypothetical protein
MLRVFLKKIEEFLLEREEEMAKQCKISPKEVENEITKVLLKIKETKEQCKEYQKEFEYLLDKLHWIKARAIQCQNELKKEIEK